MDFASLMKSQISSATAKSDPKEKKYLRRADVEAERQAAYAREQEEREKQKEAKREQKRKREEEDADRNAAREAKKKRLAEESRKLAQAEAEEEERARRKRLGLPELPPTMDTAADENAGGDGDDIPDEKLDAKLRELGEPKMLFGESHKQRLKRYRRLTAAALAPTLTQGPIPTSLVLVPEAEMKVPSSVPTDEAERAFLLRQLASYFDMVLSEWSLALSRRPKEVKESFAGRQAANSFIAARDNLVPLFRKLESAALDNALLSSVLEIVHLAQLKRYVNANDAYLRLSIGKAAWPIGVTMVGIHERSAREKLHETEKAGGKAHILSDEETRKMLQGIKRCLSFAQTRWPPEDNGQLMG
ncbi:Hypothetical protein R9X50_00626200 [Acrodontium crateriforme]|uniref:Pre-mRNA-splicing factor 18 n=1 Tax=Acrodontium crateriforme TaxID=150365 RepID=A0AAQ3MAQ8_9PEZI|nr:Hypothetical protein R9X50_00626200 [Acrodontium crateriforme]